MSRLIFLLAVVAVVYWLLRSYFKQSPKQATPEPSAEEMVRCVQCGVHLPKSESILAGGEYFCSDAHRRDRAGRSE